MSRGKWLKGSEPWKEYGLTKSAYYKRMQKGQPLIGSLYKGRPKDKLPDLETVRKIEYGRYSGMNYTNSKEKIEAIKQKYKNGVTLQILEEMFL